MWVWHQRTGRLSHDDQVVGVGYAGHGEGINNPALQHVKKVGPLPRGDYTIGKPLHVDKKGLLGPFVLPLRPDPENEMYGRSRFFIHGDAIGRPGTASEGCIVLGRRVREAIAAGENRLRVVED